MKVQAKQWTTSEPIQVYVGTPPTCFHIHRQLLVQQSKWFDQFFKTGNWRDKQPKRVNWFGQNVEVFEVLVACLYGEQLNIDRGENTLVLVADCFMFARMFQVEKMGDEVVKAYQDHLRSAGTYPGLYTVKYLDDLGLRMSSLRMFAFRAMITGVAKNIDGVLDVHHSSHEFVNSVQNDREIIYLLPNVVLGFLEVINQQSNTKLS